MKLPLHERFHSWQGEGVHLGKSAYFLRLFGCPVHCPWCDSAGTWHPDYIPKNIDRIEVSELVDFAVSAKPEFVVVTGGEPTIHSLEELTGSLHANRLRVHLETSGAFPIRGDFDWITLSPKWQKLPLKENLARASEFKLIVESGNSIRQWQEFLGDSNAEVPTWLHPEWSQRDNPDVLESITNWVKQHGFPYRAGYQFHKLFKADSLDPHAAKNAPLGGDLQKGY